jgi:hypothetical protein
MCFLHLQGSGVELKTAPNDKIIFNVEYVHQCKITFETSKDKGYCSMCKLSKIWAHQKLLPLQTDLLQMHRQLLDRSMPLKRKI